MGVSLNGHCYKDSAEALRNFSNLYPMADGTHMVEYKQGMTIGGNMIIYELSSTLMESNVPITKTWTIRLPPCDYNDVTLGADYGFSVFIGCALMFALGFIGTR